VKNITLKNIPDRLYERLKRAAEQHRRSINGEILACLERSVLPRALDVDEVIARAQDLRERVGRAALKTEELLRARDRGRK
jgi:plasmid stability protein